VGREAGGSRRSEVPKGLRGGWREAAELSGVRPRVGGPRKRLRGAMFHLDYLSCFLTVLATILLARKSWVGLLIAIVNSLIVSAIALRTSQLGFIPANLFCICIYAFSVRSWLKEQTRTNRDQAQPQDSGSVADGPPKGLAMQHREAAGKRPRAVEFATEMHMP
jgi:hypothetical protein